MERKKEAYVGIDIGKRICVVCAMDKDRNILYEGKYPNTRADAAVFADTVLAKYDSQAVCESTGNLWFKTFETLEERGISIVLANPLRLKLSQSGNKTDKLDARHLANRLRMKDVPTCRVHPPKKRHNLDLLYQRGTLVQDRTRVLNRQHAICDKYDYRTTSGHGNTSGSKYQEFLNGLKLKPGDTRIMAQQVRQVKYLNGEISLLDDRIREAARQSKDARLIMSLPGFDAFSALLVAESIDGIGRFAGPKQLVSFLGLCPRVYQSGDSIRHGRMKKDADGRLTWIMMNAAMIAHQYDPYLSALYENYRKRHLPLVARSHLANKMGAIIWHMLTNREPYRFRDEQAYQAKLARLGTGA